MRVLGSKAVLLFCTIVVGSLIADASQAQTSVTSDVTSDTSWGPPGSGAEVIDPVLEVPITVRDGATLTIFAGTIVRGQPRQNVQSDPGALIVSRSGRIHAAGDSNDPIIFTTAAVDNNGDGIADDVSPADDFPDSWSSGDAFLDDAPLNEPLAPLDPSGAETTGLWGGVAILGESPTNLDDSQNLGGVWGLGDLLRYGCAYDLYGGDLVHDSSGHLLYASIRHAGDEFACGTAQEDSDVRLSGLTLAGVGDATEIRHIEVYSSHEDGVQWLGGTVDLRYLVSLLNGDDAFDFDQGFQGVSQYVFALMPFFDEASGDAFGDSSGDKIGEWDGDDSPASGFDFSPDSGHVDGRTRCTPLPISSVWNMTAIGSTAPAGSDAPQSNADNLGIQMRNGFAGRLFNALVVNTGSAQGLQIDTTDRNDATNCSDTIDHVNQGLVSVAASSFDGVAAMTAAENQALTNGDDLASVRGGGPNYVNSPSFPGLANEDHTFDPTGNAQGKLVSGLKSAPLDPRPVLAPGAFQPVPPTGNRVDDATFRGAFAPGAPLWTAGWTVLDRAGLMVSN